MMMMLGVLYYKHDVQHAMRSRRNDRMNMLVVLYVRFYAAGTVRCLLRPT
jgi:hypothetical protein